MFREMQNFTVLTTLCNPNLWIKPITWTRLLSRSRFSTNQLLSYQETVRFTHPNRCGTPTEPESDHCLIKIVRSSSKKECKIPATCTAILMKEDNSTGYCLTHRLLMVQVAKAVSKMLENFRHVRSSFIITFAHTNILYSQKREKKIFPQHSYFCLSLINKKNLLQLGCEQVKTESLLSLVPVYCTKILQELVNLEAWNFPGVGQDLMMEQSACDKNILYCINPLTAVIDNACILHYKHKCIYICLSLKS